MTSSQIRELFLKFFKERGHAVIPSASLVPENDPTTLFTGSGMQPMMPFLLGEKHSLGTRLVDSQKCFRAQDIEEVGDNRHTTFFEMLGNWSFGDYFKDEQIAWMFEFLTKIVGLDPARLYVSVFAGKEELGIPRDEEAVALWQKAFASAGIEARAVLDADVKGMQGGRIVYYPEKKNWWSRSGTTEKMPVGEPGGPDSEMFWDFGAALGLHESSPWNDKPCHLNCDCGRYLEIGNNVFMQYRKEADGSFGNLPKKNIDFGGGLERIAAVANDDPDMFRVDLFDRARVAIEGASGKRYGVDADDTLAFRVILDHVRAATFLIGDSVKPSNKDQGYYARRLLRRAVRFARRLGVVEVLARTVAEAFIETYQDAYPELVAGRATILGEIEAEETKFAKTIEHGLRELKRIVEHNGSFTGRDAFDLYQSYGFPLELTAEELSRSHGLSVDEVVFKEEFRKHQELSRAGGMQKFAGGLADRSVETTRLHTATHLLHQALETVLSESVVQKGSNITPERLRFDFSHSSKLTTEELRRVEDLVNKAISDDLPVFWTEMTLEEAKAASAFGYFEEKYAKIEGKLKVYTVGDETHGIFSREICGGPHVARTGELGGFKIQKEEAVAAGIRRIKAIVGK